MVDHVGSMDCIARIIEIIGINYNNLAKIYTFYPVFVTLVQTKKMRVRHSSLGFAASLTDTIFKCRHTAS